MKKDKVLHWMFGFFGSLAVGMPLQNPWLGLASGIVAGLTKELVWDLWLKKGTPEFTDFLATLIGAGMAFAILLLAKF